MERKIYPKRLRCWLKLNQTSRYLSDLTNQGGYKMSHAPIIKAISKSLLNVHGEDYALCLKKLKELRKEIKSKESIKVKRKSADLCNEVRDQNIINMRMDGHTYKTIGELHGMSTGRAQSIYKEHLRKLERHYRRYKRFGYPILRETKMKKITYYFERD